MDLPTPTLDHVCDLHVSLDPIIELGRGRAGQRRIIPIVGGKVTGPRLQGRILNIGADWQTVMRDGMAELDTRYAMETGDGAVIEIINFGYRHGPADAMRDLAAGKEVDPRSYYMRTHARLETGDERYTWVNSSLFVGVGARTASAVLVRLYEVT